MSTEETPIGNYMARAVKGSEQYAPSAGGEPQIAVDFAIEGGEQEGATMTVVFSFSGKAPEYSIKKLRQCGWEGDDLEDLTGIDANAVPVRVFDDTYENREGKRVTRRKMEMAWGGDGKFRFDQQMDPRQKKGFAATFRSLAKSIPPKRATADDFPRSYGGGATGATKY